MQQDNENQRKRQEYKLNQEQIADFREAFSLFDKDSDGIIKTSELPLLIRSLNQNPTQQELADFITEVDPEGTGQVDFPEFISLMARKWKDVDGEEVLLDAFKVFDKNNDGTCSTQELFVVLKQLGEKLTDEECNELVKLADPDDNRSFRYEDFVRLLTTSYLN